jgi:AraC-like DNA-binding protein
MSLKWEKMKEKIDQMNAYNAFAKLEECIGIDSNSSASIQLKSLFERHFTKGLCDSDAFYDLTIATLEEPCDQGFLTERSDKTELIEDLVKLLYEDREGMPPLTISEITKYLNTERESLSVACRANFDMPILDLIKSIRLEQVKKSYLNPHVPKGLKNFTKKQNALYYGFKNWETFQRFYYQTFQESPDETISKSSKASVLVTDLFTRRSQ